MSDQVCLIYFTGMKFDVDSISFLDISYSNPYGCLTSVSVGFPSEKIISKANKNHRAHLGVVWDDLNKYIF
ncbi:unnamed protein product [Camellia sinensis]